MKQSRPGRPIKSPFNQKRVRINLTLAPACIETIRKLAKKQGITLPDWIENQALQQEKQHATTTSNPNEAQDSNDNAIQ